MLLKRTSAVAAAALLAFSLAACGDDSGDDSTADDSSSSASDTSGDESSEGSTDVSCEYNESGEAAREVDAPPSEAKFSGEVQGTIATSQGDLPITLDADAAPCTVNSFVSLADQGFFDDTPCPRVTTDGGLYVLQCGDPTGTTAGGPGYTVPDELTGQETYPAGTLAMANSGTPDSGGSQFFIVWKESGLSPDYTVFGTVSDEGIKVVEKVAAAGSDNSNPAGGGAPLQPVDITEVSIDD